MGDAVVSTGRKDAKVIPIGILALLPAGGTGADHVITTMSDILKKGMVEMGFGWISE
jgi:hypothetical protein